MIKKNLIWAMLSIIPIFMLWQLTVNRLILPAVTYSSVYVTKHIFAALQPELVFEKDMKEWQLKTGLVKIDRPLPNNTFNKNKKSAKYTYVPIGSLTALTLGFPLFCILMILCGLGISRKMLLGNAVLLCVASVNVTLLMQYKLIAALQGSSLLRVYSGSYLKFPSQPPLWLNDVLKPVLDATGYMSVLVLPVWLAWHYYQKGLIQASIPNDQNSHTQV